jgi:CBS-domain-containing membrane protein
MTSEVATATPDTPLHELATLMERSTVKRVPIVKDGQLVGIVSRANIAWARPWPLNVLVNDGVVDLWGVARSDAEKTAIRVAAVSIPGVRAVNDNLVIRRRQA